MPVVDTAADPVALRKSLRARGLVAEDLVRERVVARATKTRLTSGRSVRPAVLRRVDAWLRSKPLLVEVDVLEVGA